MDKQAEIARIKAEYEARNREIDKQSRNANLRIGGGAILQGISALPIFNIPYVGTGLGGALFEAGNAIMEGKSGEDIKNDAGRGFLIGEAVGFLPPVAQKLAKTKAGQAVGNQASKLYNYLADTKVGQKVAEIAPKVEDALMTDIKAYNPFKKTQTAYHGSPYDFNKFSNEAIGTGEGAQAHGMGHYSALNKSTAQEYADRLGQYSLENPDKIIFDYQTNKDLIAAHQLGKEQFIKKLQNMIEIEDYDDEIVNLRNRIKNVEKNYDKVNLTRNKQLYKLAIPKDDVMLREDLLLSEQPKFIQNAFKDEVSSFKNGLKEELQSNIDAKNILLESLQNAKAKGSDRLIYAIEKDIERNMPVYERNIWQLQDQLNQNIPAAINKTGRAIYDELGDKASNILSNKGIKGISYNGGIDGEARVIFNPNDIEIVRKYYNQPSLGEQILGKTPNAGALSTNLYDYIKNDSVLTKGYRNNKNIIDKALLNSTRKVNAGLNPLTKTNRSVLYDEIEEPFKIAEAEKILAQDIERHLKGEMTPSEMINFGKPSVLLKSLGTPDLEMHMPQHKYDMSTERKMIQNNIHKVPDEIMKKIPTLLTKPKYVFKSASKGFENKRFVVQVDAYDKDNNPVFVIVDYSNPEQGINIIPSIYGKEQYENFINNNINNIVYKE